MIRQDYKHLANGITDYPEAITSEAYKLILCGVAVAVFLDWCAR